GNPSGVKLASRSPRQGPRGPRAAPRKQGGGRYMPALYGLSDVRMRALLGHCRTALLARGTILLLALLMTLAFTATSRADDGAADEDPLPFTIGGGLTVAAVGAFVHGLRRLRGLSEQKRRLEERVELLSDRNWELKEAEERARSFLEAQGDVIVRRDRDGCITYANDAFCALAGTPPGGRNRAALAFSAP